MYNRHSSKRAQVRPYGKSYVTLHSGGATVHSQTNNVGYGFTEYYIVGTMQEVSLAVDGILSRYPNDPYGTFFNWPPNTKKITWGPHEGEPLEHRAAEDLGNGLWLLTGKHSNTSD